MGMTYNAQDILGKLKKLSEITRDQKTVISIFAHFLSLQPNTHGSFAPTRI